MAKTTAARRDLAFFELLRIWLAEIMAGAVVGLNAPQGCAA